MGILILITIVVIILVLLLKNKFDKPVKNKRENNFSDANPSPDQKLVFTVHVDAQPQIPQSADQSKNDQANDGYNDNYWIRTESKSRKVSANLRLKYQNTRNIISERNFDVQAFSRGENGYYIHGFCHKKNKNITLSSLGILEVTDVQNGQAIENITNYLEQKYVGTTEHKKDMLFDDYGWAVYSLVYLAATSGSIVKKEREVIKMFIKSIPQFFNLEDEWIEKTIRELYRPGKMESRNWVKAAMDKGADYSLILPAVLQLSELQKDDNKEFISFRKYIENQIDLRKSTAT